MANAFASLTHAAGLVNWLPWSEGLRLWPDRSLGGVVCLAQINHWAWAAHPHRWVAHGHLPLPKHGSLRVHHGDWPDLAVTIGSAPFRSSLSCMASESSTASGLFKLDMLIGLCSEK